MLNTLSKTIQWTLLLGLSQTAAAATCDFSCTFTANNTRVVGSFDGTTTGDDVVGISNIQVAHEGRELVGPL